MGVKQYFSLFHLIIAQTFQNFHSFSKKSCTNFNLFFAFFTKNPFISNIAPKGQQKVAYENQKKTLLAAKNVVYCRVREKTKGRCVHAKQAVCSQK
jgi:hypothetical protein